MSGADDLRASLEAIRAARLRELGGPLTPEEILAYRAGTLRGADLERFEALLPVDPDAARALLDIEAFPDIEPAPGVPALTEEELAEGWARLRRRLTGGAAADDRPSPTSGRDDPPLPR